MLQIDPITIQPFLLTKQAFANQVYASTRVASSPGSRHVSASDNDFLYRIYVSYQAEAMKLSPWEVSKTKLSANSVQRAAGPLPVVFSTSPP